MQHLEVAKEAARAAGELLRARFQKPLTVNATTAHDIKLEVDVVAQELITEICSSEFPEHALYGEEGIVGDQASDFQWIVDPLDGTVNYFYGIPHFCVSIALRFQGEVIVGVIYDPMRDELWSGEKGGQRRRLNGTAIRVSPARRSWPTRSFRSGSPKPRRRSMPACRCCKNVHRARKCRMMGSAALDLAYVACGRLDAYIEPGSAFGISRQVGSGGTPAAGSR